MKNALFYICLFSLVMATKLFSLSVSREDAHQIAEKIWKNECGSSIEGLTHWNKGENFGSFGIGHFIWYSKGKREHFQETFPQLLRFFEEEGIELPSWLKIAEGAPWSSREVFYQNINHSEMISLRKLLIETKQLQAIFMANRLEQSFQEMVEKLSAEQKEQVQNVFYSLSKDPRGLYALIDYLNFKGSGLSSSEAYKGQGWGLLHVLQGISSNSSDLLNEFIKSAKTILIRRVENSPPERNEQRWLKGWLNRIDTYSK